MKYRFHPHADSELVDAAFYYEQLNPGLGFDFLEEVDAAVQRILDFPDAWTPLSKRARRCIINRFPYGVIYQIKTDVILIVAVGHLHREPNYWKKRLE